MKRILLQLVLVLVLVLEGYCQTAAFKRTGTNLPFVVTVASNHVLMVERGGGLAPANVTLGVLRDFASTNAHFNYIDPVVSPGVRVYGQPNHANLDRLWNFNNLIEFSNKPIRILLVTDELGFPGDETFYTSLSRVFNTGNGGMTVYGGGEGAFGYITFNATPFGNTLSGLTNYIYTDSINVFTNGAYQNYHRLANQSISGTNLNIDTISVCYAVWPLGGTFKIQTNSANAWVDALTVNSFHATETNAGTTNITFTLTNMTYRLIGATGTNWFHGSGAWNSQTNDLILGKFYINAGPTLEAVANARTNVSWPWWKFLNPDLILILDSGMVLGGEPAIPTPSTRMSNTLAKLETMWSNNCPNADVVHFGWIQTTPDLKSDYNKMLREGAIDYRRGFFDTTHYIRAEDVTNMIPLGLFQTDLVHVNGFSTAYLNRVLWGELFRNSTLLNPAYSHPRLSGPGAKFLRGSLGNISGVTNLGTMHGLSGGDSKPSILVDNDILGRDVWCRQLISTGAVAELTWRMQDNQTRTVRLSGKGARVAGFTEAASDVYFAITNNAGEISYGWSMNGYPAGYAVQFGTHANRYRVYSTTTYTSAETKSTNYTAKADDHTLIFHGTSLTVTLPVASSAGFQNGKVFVIKNFNATALTVARASNGTIDGVTVDDTIALNGAVTYTSDSQGWVRTAKFTP